MDTYLPKSFALTGATGALGFAFLQHMFRAHPQLKATILVRKTSSAFQSETFQSWLAANQSRLTLVEGDVRQLKADQIDALLPCDGGLWHFAALTALTAQDETITREINEVNVEGTRRLVNARLKYRGAGPFYHVSTAYVAGDRSGTVLETESALDQNFRNPYEASKLAAETHVLRAFAAGMPGVIFRPSVVVDDQAGTGGIKMMDAAAYAVALAVKRGEPFVFRLKPCANLNMIHSDWVIAALADLARLPSGFGNTYHLTAPRDTHIRDIATILERLVPNLKVSFEPNLQRSDLPTASKIFDKAVTELRQYLEADIHFDRANTNRDLSPNVREHPLDLESYVKHRLQSELERIAHRSDRRDPAA